MTPAARRAVPTTCRVCEAACGLLADLDDRGDVARLRPDPDHPVSRGYACRKGTTFHTRVHAAPDRLLRPRLRDSAEGPWREVGWDEASSTLGERLAAIARAHGPGSVGVYSGNVAGHAFGTVLGVAGFQRGFATTRHYSCLTLDNSQMFVVADAVFGNPFATFVADYAGADRVLLVGTDPLSSQASQAQSQPGAGAALRDRGRAGQLAVVDPRRSDTAAVASRHLQPRVGTDVFLLGWLAGKALAARRATLDGAEILADAVAPFDRARTARITGLGEDALDALWAFVAGGARPLVWSGLGVLLGPHGTLGWWLTLVVQAALGGLDAPGGWRLQPGLVDVPRWAHRLGLRAHDGVASPVGGWPAILGTLPAATLARDAQRDDPDRLRALVVVGGDPAAALPDTGEAARGLRALELLVCVDVRATGATADLAHAVLPATTWLERDESGVHVGNARPVPHLRLDRAVTPPAGEARNELAILADLCDAAGRAPFGSRAVAWLVRRLGPTGITRALAALSGASWAEVCSPTGASGLPRAPGAPHPAIGAPKLAVPAWCAAIRALPDPSPPEPGELALVTSVRPIGAMNHWLPAHRDAGPVEARVHPDDAEPGPATLDGETGSLDVVLVADPSLARGTVVVPFGRGANALVGSAALDPFTGQPRSNGARVRVRGRADGRG